MTEEEDTDLHPCYEYFLQLLICRHAGPDPASSGYMIFFFNLLGTGRYGLLSSRDISHILWVACASTTDENNTGIRQYSVFLIRHAGPDPASS